MHHPRPNFNVISLCTSGHRLKTNLHVDVLENGCLIIKKEFTVKGRPILDGCDYCQCDTAYTCLAVHLATSNVRIVEVHLISRKFIYMKQHNIACNEIRQLPTP